jgi:DNA repair exonuclease SbcCD ATPase subunit
MTQTSPAPVPPPKKPESRLGKWFRSALRWAVAVALVFVAGIAVLWFAQVRPLRAQVESLRSDLQAAQAEVEALQPLREQNQTLQAEADLDQSRLLLLRSMVDVTSAQVALALGRPDDASAALLPTDERLASLLNVLQDAQAREQVGQIRDRLSLVQTELGDNAFAAQNDLEVVASDLAALEGSLGAQ